MTFGVIYGLCHVNSVFYVSAKRHNRNVSLYFMCVACCSTDTQFKPKYDQVHDIFLNMGQNFTPNSNLFSCNYYAGYYRSMVVHVKFDTTYRFPFYSSRIKW